MNTKQPRGRGPTLAKDMNRKLVYSALKERRTSTRAELAAVLGLNKNTVNSIIDEWIASGYVQETGLKAHEGAGRRAVSISLQASRKQAIGIQINSDTIQAVVTDLYAVPLESFTLKRTHRDAEGTVRTILQAVERIAAHRPQDCLLGVGVGVPALLNPAGDTVAASSHLGWRNVPLLSMLRSQCSLPVRIDNAVKMAAVGELWNGTGKETEHFLYCSFGTGIGCGIISCGSLVRGDLGVAGEIGHMIVEPEGPRCTCGNRGCLEAVVGLPAIYERLLPHIDLPHEQMTEERLEEAFHAAGEAGEQELSRIASAIGHALAIAVNLLNPRVIVCDGPLMRLSDQLLPRIRAVIRDKTLPYSASRLKLQTSALYPLTGAIGAAATIIADFEKHEEPLEPISF